MMLRSFILLAALASGCTCNKTITEKAPDDLASKGIVIDQPAEGAKLTGAWVTVAGWVAPEGVQSLAAIGAPVDGFYEVTGHVGVPTVAVMIRKDGRFFAPRVPLQDGEVTLKLIPFSQGGTSYQAVTRTVTASQTTVVPATLVIEPAQPKPGEKATLRATTGADLSTPFQWDFDGDGTFEAEGASVTHSWEAGRYTVVARTKVNDVFVSAVSKVTVTAAPKVLLSASLTNAPRCIELLGSPAPGLVKLGITSLPDGGPIRSVSLIAVCDGDEVKVFDKDLVPQFVLTGLAQPHSVASDDEGNLYVADTGHDRIVRFTQTGELDPRFGQGGEFRGTAELPIKGPKSVFDEMREVVLSDGSELVCWLGSPLHPEEKLPKRPCQLQDSAQKEARRLGVTLTGVFRGGLAMTTEGRPMSLSPTYYSLADTRGKVVDAAAGPTEYLGDLATVDEDGVIDVYRSGDHDAKWVLPYKATAIASDGKGRLWVGGPGVIELRDFEALR